MRGNWYCPPIWQWPDPFRGQLRPGLLRTVLSLALLGAAGLGAQQTVAPVQSAGIAGADLEASSRLLLAVSHPGVNVAAMLEYYSRTSPDIHAEIRTHIVGAADDAAAYLGRLAEHYVRLDRVRERNPAEFERLMSLDLLESRARMLGKLILQFSSATAEGASADPAVASAALSRAKDELRGVLERAFDSTQQNQRIELNRLDAELRTMRRLLDERASKRDLIIRQRFLELCGQDLPASPAAPVVKNETPPP
jgi:hypothetical protein